MLLAIFWLILIAVTPNSQTATHVGTFPNLDECKKAADSAIIARPGTTTVPEITYVCVPTNAANP
jgi:UDP-N-acetylglucosamine:LPS N-acetylglucosamine transferase